VILDSPPYKSIDCCTGLFGLCSSAIGRGRIVVDRVYDDLNSLESVSKSGYRGKEWLRKGAVRSYIYSNADSLCPAADIVRHAMEAARLGLRVKNEVWVGSGHVAHMKLDPERYWNVVKKMWEERS
jgi:Eukaryotic protein of unknown function (DUF829)